ncbi:hypothetical protein HZZ00_37950 (plasmid) [Streptomyces sp. NEAU-sy36]|uniref:hypothetical protein n=1 Tax=unclassified Streptomyces TaxID=2593676 RepID=UPI0015D5F7C2|nr:MULTISPECIES: hypothetical protein [unclassified Streptomyces]QLJ06815.1 hypothetical protein HZZ00_37950 [Streptomyces sp. NEAU-sy36]
MTDQLDLDAIQARAARLYERTATIDPNAHPDFGQLTDADVPALVAEVRRCRARTLTESEHNRAWHAIEGAAGQEGADPGTVLNAVLRALGINPPATDDCPGCEAVRSDAV